MSLVSDYCDKKTRTKRNNNIAVCVTCLKLYFLKLKHAYVAFIVKCAQ